MTDYFDAESRRSREVVDVVANAYGPDSPITQYARGEIKSGLSTEVVVVSVDTTTQTQQ